MVGNSVGISDGFSLFPTVYSVENYRPKFYRNFRRKLQTLNSTNALFYSFSAVWYSLSLSNRNSRHRERHRQPQSLRPAFLLPVNPSPFRLIFVSRLLQSTWWLGGDSSSPFPSYTSFSGWELVDRLTPLSDQKP